MEYFQGIRFVLIYTMFLNLLVTAAKLVAGYLTGSLSLIADGFDSLFDSLSNVVGLVGIYISRRPADSDHPYGHRRYEILMTLVVSVFLFLTTSQILRSAYERLLHPVVPQVNIWSMAALIFSVGMHLYVSFYEKRRGQELKSEFLVADALHTRADIFVSLGVIAGLTVVRLGYPIVDTALAVVIAIVIAKIGVDIIRDSTRILTDAAAVDVGRVAAVVQEVPGVESYHHIRSRGQEDDVHLDLHIRVAANLPLAQAHLIAHQVQRKLQEAFSGVRDVVVHVEPQPAASPPHNDVLERVREIGQDTGTTIHHLNAHEINGRYFVDLHLEVAGGLPLGEAHTQASLLENKIKSEIPEITEIHTHIEPAMVMSGEFNDMDSSQIMEKVRQLVHGMPEVHDCHDIQAHWADSKLVLTLHCTLDAQLSIVQAHEIVTSIEQRLRRDLEDVASVSIHVEPNTPVTPSA